MKATVIGFLICQLFTLSINAQNIVGNWKLTWILIEIDMAYSIVAPITLRIEENGKFSGNGGCNSFTGKYSFKKPKKMSKKPLKIRFSEINVTKLPCENPSRTETVFLRSLNEANTVFILKEELVIESTKIGNMMNFVKSSKIVN